jgi:hypothetical protein
MAFKLLGEHATPFPLMCTQKHQLRLSLTVKTGYQGSCSMLAVDGSEIVQVVQHRVLLPQCVGVRHLAHKFKQRYQQLLYTSKETGTPSVQ